LKPLQVVQLSLLLAAVLLLELLLLLLVLVLVLGLGLRPGPGLLLLLLVVVVLFADGTIAVVVVCWVLAGANDVLPGLLWFAAGPGLLDVGCTSGCPVTAAAAASAAPCS
jgi:hypothetical protein